MIGLHPILGYLGPSALRITQALKLLDTYYTLEFDSVGVGISKYQTYLLPPGCTRGKYPKGIKPLSGLYGHHFRQLP